jgi:hypothetical protein
MSLFFPAPLLRAYSQHLSFRGTEAFLEDCPEWLADIGMTRAPDHNTLCDAFEKLTAQKNINALLDEILAHCARTGLLDTRQKPVALDSSHYETHHVSRHFERRREQTSGAEKNEKISRAISLLPKIALCVACSCHLILSVWTGTGCGNDQTHLWPVLTDAWRRTQLHTVVADAGYDAEKTHALIAGLGLRGIVPVKNGQQNPHVPPTPLRAQMQRDFQSGAVASEYGQRWQIETVNSMMKRNYSSALRAATASHREQELALKALVHNLAI